MALSNFPIDQTAAALRSAAAGHRERWADQAWTTTMTIHWVVVSWNRATTGGCL